MTAASDIHVAVLKGGWSAEREVSLRSGTACAAALARLGYRVSEIDVDRSIASILAEMRPDIAFNALHGRWGEDGCVQGILETLQIPYTHSGVRASAIAMDKAVSKTLFRSAGLPVAESLIVPVADLVRAHPMEPPYVVKPQAEGSSVGVHIVGAGANRPVELRVEEADLFGERAMVERYIPGRELTCAVMGDEALGVIDIVAQTKFYDYEAKYAPGGSIHIIPAEIPKEDYERVRACALAAHRALGCRGVSRADFRYDDTPDGNHELIILEVNTQPGMTTTSLVPEMAEHAGYSFEDLVRWMVEDASCDR